MWELLGKNPHTHCLPSPSGLQGTHSSVPRSVVYTLIFVLPPNSSHCLLPFIFSRMDQTPVTLALSVPKGHHFLIDLSKPFLKRPEVRRSTPQ